jgi:hypothetical protein
MEDMPAKIAAYRVRSFPSPHTCAIRYLSSLGRWFLLPEVLWQQAVACAETPRSSLHSVCSFQACCECIVCVSCGCLHVCHRDRFVFHFSLLLPSFHSALRSQTWLCIASRNESSSSISASLGAQKSAFVCIGSRNEHSSSLPKSLPRFLPLCSAPRCCPLRARGKYTSTALYICPACLPSPPSRLAVALPICLCPRLPL